MQTSSTPNSPLSDFQFKLHIISLQSQAPEQPSHLSLFYATSLEVHQIASWCRASPFNTLSDLPIVNDPKDLMLKDDGMALCLYDDTMKVWSTAGDWVPQWSEVGKRIVDAIQKNPTIQSSWNTNINNLNVGYDTLQNFREDMWVDENGSVRPVSSPFMLSKSLDEEVKKLEAAYINLPHSEDEDDAQPPRSPLSDISEPVTTPPLSPCSLFESPDSLFSPCYLPGSPLQTPFQSTSPLSLGLHQTVSPYEVFSPLPRVGEDSRGDTIMQDVPAPPTPTVPTKSLPELVDECSESTLSSPQPSTSRSPSPDSPIAGPSSSLPKRPRWTEEESGDESDDFMPQRRKTTRPGKRLKGSPFKRGGVKLEGKGTKCDLCGMRLGRATDLPRHKASCKSNPERATRGTPCEFCGKLLPVRPDAIKRHLASKSCLSRRNKDENPHLSES